MMTQQWVLIRAVSPVIATIALIAVATVAASVAGAEAIRRSQVSSTSEKPLDITDMFLVKLSDSRVMMHAEYNVRPGWTSITATFRDDVNNVVTFALPTDLTVRNYDLELTAQVTVGNRYNVIITSIGASGTNSATTTVSIFVR